MTPGTQALAPLSSRFVALLIDSFFHIVINFVIALFIRDYVSFIFALAAQVAVIHHFYAKTGATIGKRIMRIKALSTETKGNLKPWQGVYRETVGHYLSGLLLGLGFLVSLFNREKRAFHDYVFQTVVVEE